MRISYQVTSCLYPRRIKRLTFIQNLLRFDMCSKWFVWAITLEIADLGHNNWRIENISFRYETCSHWNAFFSCIDLSDYDIRYEMFVETSALILHYENGNGNTQDKCTQIVKMAKYFSHFWSNANSIILMIIENKWEILKRIKKLATCTR